MTNAVFMKQFYTLVAVSLMASVAFAQGPQTRHSSVQRMDSRQSLTTQLQQSGRMASKSAKVFKADALADIIYDQPEGTPLHNWYGYKQGYYNFFYNPFEGTNDGDADELVLADDGTVYLKNPVSFYPDCKSWIKGTKATGDTIAFEFPQKVFEEEVNGKHYDYCLYRMVRSGNDWAVDENTQTVKFVFRNDSLFKADTESLMGLCSEDGSTWTCYGDYNVVVTKMDETTVAPNNPAAAQTYKMDYTVEGENKTSVVKLAIEGTDAYLCGFSSNQPDAWAKGRVESDGRIVFSGRTYLGVNEQERCHTWFVPVTVETGTLPNGYAYEDYTETSQFVLTPNASTGSYASDGAFIVNIGQNTISAWDVVVGPTLTPFTEVPGKPQKPEFVGLQPYDDVEMYGGIRFNLYPYSEEGNYLNPDKLFYRIYFDMTPYTFTPDEYSSLEASMTDIPYAFSDGYDFIVSDELHTVYYYRNDFETLGVAAFYKDGDQIYPSTMVYINVKNITEDIEGVADSHGETLTTYYDLSGRRVSQPARGLYIVTQKGADGTVKSTKKVFR